MQGFVEVFQMPLDAVDNQIVLGSAQVSERLLDTAELRQKILDSVQHS